MPVHMPNPSSATRPNVRSAPTSMPTAAPMSSRSSPPTMPAADAIPSPRALTTTSTNPSSVPTSASFQNARNRPPTRAPALPSFFAATDISRRKSGAAVAVGWKKEASLDWPSGPTEASSSGMVSSPSKPPVCRPSSAAAAAAAAMAPAEAPPTWLSVYVLASSETARG